MQVDPARIPLYSRGGIAAYALVDEADAALVGEHRWFLNNTGYARRVLPRERGRRRSVLLHRQLLGLQAHDRREVDHINRNPLDNRRSNLRVVTAAQNRQNANSYVGSTSRYRGVSWWTQGQKWRAQAAINGRNFQLGVFEDEKEAAAAAALFRLLFMPFTVEEAI